MMIRCLLTTLNKKSMKKQHKREKEYGKQRPIVGNHLRIFLLIQFDKESANVGGLPFKFVENETFIEYTNALKGKVVVPCRRTTSKNMSLYYQEEKKKLVTFLCNSLNTVHLTTDCSTSPSKIVHYICWIRCLSS
uniref:Uncharacterized protein n=1 Tax=Lactuca sativa TaxID=4236 RepID=A0A9R1VJS3_LACSA|nr:hypothetical protein LSAT_V11C500240470 [Lactuca sativa]